MFAVSVRFKGGAITETIDFPLIQLADICFDKIFIRTLYGSSPNPIVPVKKQMIHFSFKKIFLSLLIDMGRDKSLYMKLIYFFQKIKTCLFLPSSRFCTVDSFPVY